MIGAYEAPTRGEKTLEFAGSKDPTIGVEIELQLIDPASRRLVNAAPRVLGHFPSRDRVKAEMMQAQIELNTVICRDSVPSLDPQSV